MSDAPVVPAFTPTPPVTEMGATESSDNVFTPTPIHVDIQEWVDGSESQEVSEIYQGAPIFIGAGIALVVCVIGILLKMRWK